MGRALLCAASLSDSALTIYELKLFAFASLEVPLLIVVDTFSLTFLLTVLLISLRVFTFSRSYMAPEQHFTRFHLILARFVASMLVLIFRPGLVSLFLG